MVVLFVCAVFAVTVASVHVLTRNPPQTVDRCSLPESKIGQFVNVPSGSFLMGAHRKYLEESKPRRVHVQGFQLQIHEVTNQQFARFVAATGYRTSAERNGGSAVFSPQRATQSGSQYPMSWWRLDKHATWRTPEGKGATLQGRGRYPVVHVSLEDAFAYAKWAKARLPSEVEWEYAATLGLFNRNSPDSGAIGPNGESLANIWDGHFPNQNTRKDGFLRRAPVGCFKATRLGTYDMIGNVWEWTSTTYSRGSFTIKGGSFLCSESYCHRYRTAARQGYEPNFSSEHIGIRIVRDLSTKSNIPPSRE
ncbi:MAG: formylglycine-generating enzyme family protein [Deltaproteobacteria bacterium]|nr:MAG: formylglycine-generating enzyme family protein [Deltaproteobacteria bacterium]